MKIFYLLAITIMMASCSSLKKTTSSESSKVDLTAVAKSDSSSLHKFDSAVAKAAAESSLLKKDSSSSKVEESLDQEKITVNLDPPVAGKKTANDYDGAPAVYDVTINGQQIKSSQPINNIVVEIILGKKTIQSSYIKTTDSSSKTSSESTQVAKFDSSAHHRADSLTVTAETKKQASTKKRSGFSFGARIGMIIGGILLIILGIKFRWWSRIFWWFIGLFRKKDPDVKLPYNPPPPPSTKK